MPWSSTADVLNLSWTFYFISSQHLETNSPHPRLVIIDNNNNNIMKYHYTFCSNRQIIGLRVIVCD